MAPVKLAIRNKLPCGEKGDYLVCETSELFLPLQGVGLETFSEDRLVELKKDGPMQDFEIRKTMGVRFPGGMLHLKMPTFTSANPDERKECLRRCYRVVLEKAVELDAKSIIVPFLGCLSVGIQFEEGVETGLRVMQEFIEGGKSGTVEEIELCTNHKPLYKVAINHAIYKELKKVKRSIFTFNISPRSSISDCVFKILRPTIDSAIRSECSGRTEKLTGMSCRDLFGCENVIDLILLRGGVEVDWNDKEKCRSILEMSLCSSHKQKMLTSWDSNTYHNKKNGQGRLICSLPEISHDGGVRPVTTRRLNKIDTLKLIEASGKFVHVGTAVCTHHAEAIQMQNFGSLYSSDQRAMELDQFMSLDQLDASLNEIESNMSRDKDASMETDAQSQADNLSINSQAMDIPEPPEPYRDSKKEKWTTKSLLRELASLNGLSRLTSQIPWNELKEDTKRKKRASMRRLQIELYKEAAGDHWEEMMIECIKQSGQIVDCSRVSKILQSIDERMEATTDRRERLSLISIMCGHFTEKEITNATGVSRYFIGEAKKFILYGLEEIKNIRRDRCDYQKLKKLVNFISRPEIMVQIPKPARSVALSSGESLTLAAVARLHSYRHVHAMLQKSLEEEGAVVCAANGGDVKEYVKKNLYGLTTCVKIMETVMPTRQVRMQCLDSFHADAIEAFDTAFSCVAELKESGRLAGHEAEDLRRRFRVAQNYLTGYFRMHLSLSSTCSTHCIRYGLSDASSPDYRSRCDHDHEDSCEMCNDILSVFAQFMAFLEVKAEEAEAKKDEVAGIRLRRIIEECVESELKVKEFQKHILRAASSELDRISIIDKLRDHWALVTMDYSLKLLPTGFVEPQSAWFAKKGISFHISHVQTKLGEKHLHHTLGHLNDESKQDGFAICVIGDHLFRILGENGITRVSLRSDNAANYKNAGVVHTLRVTAAKYGVELAAYIFSEPQSGKGVADNRISHAKGKLRDVVNSGGYGRDAEQILNSLTTEPLLKAFSFYQIKGNKVVRTERSKKHGEGIPKITELTSFRYEVDGIRVKKFDSIGTGKVISYEEQDEVECDYEILGQGGYLSKSPEFWGEITEKPTKRKEKNSTNEDDENDGEKLFRCPEEMCTVKYRSSKGLEDHILLGKHQMREHSDTVVEAAARLFSDRVETSEDAYLSMKIDSFASDYSAAQVQKLSEGWAVKEKKPTRIMPRVRFAVKKYFVERRSIQQRAEAKWVVKMLKNQKKPNGHYAFPVKFCLKETQAQGLITRWLKLEESKGLKAVEEEGRKNGNGEEDEDGEILDDNEELDCLGVESVKNRRGGVTNVSVERKKTVTKAKVSMNKKTATKSHQKRKPNSETSEGEETVVEEDSEDDEPGPSTSNRRSARSKKTTPVRKTSLQGRKKKAEKETSETTSSRVLRSGKRGNEDDRMNYYESEGSDGELDVHDTIMTKIHERFDQIFTNE